MLSEMAAAPDGGLIAIDFAGWRSVIARLIVIHCCY